MIQRVGRMRPAEQPQAKACPHSEAVEAIRASGRDILLGAHTIGSELESDRRDSAAMDGGVRRAA